jgi:HEAT repeat protein
MPPSLRPEAPALLLGPLLVLLPILALAIVAWLAARRQRSNVRDAQAALRRELRAYLSGECGASQVRVLADRLDAAAFWSVLETRTLDSPLPARVSRALVRCQQVMKERHALRDDSPLRRELATRRLGLIRTRWTRRALRRALMRGPELVTQSAALALARQRDAATLRWLFRHPGALARRTPRARSALLRAFGPGAHGTLLAALEQGALDPRLERAVVEVLGTGDCEAAAGAIAARLRHSVTEVRVAAARALGQLRGAPRSAELCVALRDSEWPVRAQAARALGRLGEPGAAAALGARLEDQAWWVRHHAAYALAGLGRQGRAELERIRGTSADRYAREMADEALRAG